MDLNSDYLRLERKPLCHRKKKKKKEHKSKKWSFVIKPKEILSYDFTSYKIADVVLGIALNSHEGGQQRAWSVIDGCIQTVSFLAYTNVCVT